MAGCLTAPSGQQRARRAGGLQRISGSSGDHRGHSPQVQRRTDEFPLGVYTLDAAQTELAEPQHALDSAVGRLGDPLALAIGGAVIKTRQHQVKVRGLVI